MNDETMIGRGLKFTILIKGRGNRRIAAMAVRLGAAGASDRAVPLFRNQNQKLPRASRSPNDQGRAFHQRQSNPTEINLDLVEAQIGCPSEGYNLAIGGLIE